MWQPVPCICRSAVNQSFHTAEGPGQTGRTGLVSWCCEAPGWGLCSSSLSDPSAVVISPSRNLM